MTNEQTAEPWPVPRRFTVVEERKENAPGAWNSNIVTVLDNGTPCGQYERNYPSYVESTFCPFERDGQWYALYAPDYTATRILKLPDCVDIGGEERDSFGFCPVELFVPHYVAISYDMTHDHRAGQKVEPYVERHTDCHWPEDRPALAECLSIIEHEKANGPRQSGSRNYAMSPWTYCSFGFVAGCIWGDDSSWKIQYLDLSEAPQGKLKREERFGYIQLPRRLTLAEAIDMHIWRPHHHWVGVTSTKFHNLKTGESED